MPELFSNGRNGLNKGGMTRHLNVFFRHLAYARQRLLARVTAQTGTAGPSVMSGRSPLGRLGHARNGKAKRGRGPTVERKNGGNLLGEGRQGRVWRRAVDDVRLFLLLHARKRDRRCLRAYAGILIGEWGERSARAAKNWLRNKKRQQARPHNEMAHAQNSFAHSSP